jgi:hypothetical protein
MLADASFRLQLRSLWCILGDGADVCGRATASLSAGMSEAIAAAEKDKVQISDFPLPTL